MSFNFAEFIGSNSFLLESLGFSTYNTMSSANRDNFTSFQFGWFFFFLPYLVALSGTSNTMLNKSGENGHPSHVPNIRRKACSFTIKMLAVGLSYMAFIMLW